MKDIKEIIEMLEERIIDAHLLSVAIPYIIEYLKALEILIKWFQPDIIHDLCCFGASDEEINLLKEILS